MKQINNLTKVLPFIVCPSCKKRLKEIDESVLRCGICGETFEIRNQIPYLLTKKSKKDIQMFWGLGNGLDNEKEADKLNKNYLIKMWRNIPEPITPMFSVNRRINSIYKTWQLATTRSKTPNALIVGTFLPYRRKKSNKYYATKKAYRNALRLDITEKEGTNIVADGHLMPFPDSIFDIVVAQATIKHLMNPYVFIEEVYRILKPGGLFYCEIAYLLSFHKWPGDYVRFTPQGVKELLNKFQIVETGFTRGPSYTVTEISAIFLSALLSMNNRYIYSFLMKIISWILFPIKYLDPIMVKNRWADYLGQVSYCIAKKD